MIIILHHCGIISSSLRHHHHTSSTHHITSSQINVTGSPTTTTSYTHKTSYSSPEVERRSVEYVYSIVKISLTLYLHFFTTTERGSQYVDSRKQQAPKAKAAMNMMERRSTSLMTILCSSLMWTQRVMKKSMLKLLD